MKNVSKVCREAAHFLVNVEKANLETLKFLIERNEIDHRRAYFIADMVGHPLTDSIDTVSNSNQDAWLLFMSEDGSVVVVIEFNEEFGMARMSFILDEGYRDSMVMRTYVDVMQCMRSSSPDLAFIINSHELILARASFVEPTSNDLQKIKQVAEDEGKDSDMVNSSNTLTMQFDIKAIVYGEED